MTVGIKKSKDLEPIQNFFTRKLILTFNNDYLILEKQLTRTKTRERKERRIFIPKEKLKIRLSIYDFLDFFVFASG